MEYFKQIIHYAKPYKRFAFLNVFFNVFYALFSALSFVVLMPFLKIIFYKDKAINTVKPVYESIEKLDDYFNQYFSYAVYKAVGDDKGDILIAVIILIVVVFLLKNVFSYLGFYFITFLKNGVLKDLETIIQQNSIASYFLLY